jgi:hypothetical protein
MRLHTRAGEVLVMHPREFEEILDLSDVLSAETAEDVRLEGQSLRRTAAWWRNEMLPLVAHQREAVEAAALLVQAMENVATRLERIAMTAVRPKGHA